jgi:signal transduction histidine kinase
MKALKQREATTRIGRRRRLQEIGAEAARVAHELKGPLSLIDGGLQSLEQFVEAAMQYVSATTTQTADAPVPAALHRKLDLPYLTEQAPLLLDICREGTRRLRLLSEQLQDHARGVNANVPWTLIDLVPLLREAIAMASCGRTVVPTVQTMFATEAWVHGDTHALSRVFINLIGNAFDAVAESVDPRVSVAIVPSSAPPSGWFEARISDNGPGVAPHLRSRIFAPFFSTKSRRAGLGLGLAIAKDVVDEHGGTIVLVALNGDDGAPAARRGATFVVRLPAADSTRLRRTI